MAGTRKTRVPIVEQIRLINECRQGCTTDTDWCRENNIAVSTFYNWDLNRLSLSDLSVLLLTKNPSRESAPETGGLSDQKLFGSFSERRSDDIPGQQNLFDEAEMEQNPSLLEEEQIYPVCGTQIVLICEEYVHRELEFILDTCKVVEYYSQSYGCPSCKEGLAIRKTRDRKVSGSDGSGWERSCLDIHCCMDYVSEVCQ